MEKREFVWRYFHIIIYFPLEGKSRGNPITLPGCSAWKLKCHACPTHFLACVIVTIHIRYRALIVDLYLNDIQVDDDSYVRIGPLLDRISEAHRHRLFLGFIENPGGGPHRDPKSQWYVQPDEWASEQYPPWAHGAGYVISQVISRSPIPEIT